MPGEMLDVVVGLLVNCAVGQQSVGTGRTTPLLAELLTSWQLAPFTKQDTTFQ